MDSTNSSSHMDSSSDEADPTTIRWERTPSGKMNMEERRYRMNEMPTVAAFSSNHILVNRERLQRGIDPLVRCRHLDAIAQRHAREMADAKGLLEEPIRSATMVENVQRGPSIRLIHQMIMFGVSDEEKANILDSQYTRFGMATATGEDGLMYMSQIFQSSTSKRRASM